MLPLLLLALAADPIPEPDPPAPRYEVKLRKSTDRFEARVEKGVVVWTITSLSGIGGAEVLGSTDGPKKLVVRLVNFKSLEAFGFTDGVVVLKGALNRSRPRTCYQGADGLETDDPKKAVASITITEAKAGVEVTMTFAKPGRRWKVEWIDAYR